MAKIQSESAYDSMYHKCVCKTHMSVNILHKEISGITLP